MSDTMPEPALDPRLRQVLLAVIAEYVETAQPVGSRAVARRHVRGLSPATIRNAMADLEDMGFLTHPHTSAGGVPTDKAYRFYVNALGEVPWQTAPGGQKAREAASPSADGAQRLMAETPTRLSDGTHMTGMLLAPPLRRTALDRIELAGLGGDGLGDGARPHPPAAAERRGAAGDRPDADAPLSRQDLPDHRGGHRAARRPARSPVDAKRRPPRPDRRALAGPQSLHQRRHQSARPSGPERRGHHARPLAGLRGEGAARGSPHADGRGARGPGPHRGRESRGGHARMQPHHLDLHVSRPGPGRAGRGRPAAHAVRRRDLARGRDGPARLRFTVPRPARALPPRRLKKAHLLRWRPRLHAQRTWHFELRGGATRRGLSENYASRAAF